MVMGQTEVRGICVVVGWDLPTLACLGGSTSSKSSSERPLLCTRDGDSHMGGMKRRHKCGRNVLVLALRSKVLSDAFGISQHMSTHSWG